MNILRILSLILVGSSLVLGDLSPSSAGGSNQTQCPVRGSAVNKKVYTDYKGKRIYFCCPPCISDFKKNPEKFMKKLREEGVVLEDAPGSSTK